MALNTIQVTVRINELSRRNSRRDDRWRHHRSPPTQFRHGTKREGNILQSPALVIQPYKHRKRMPSIDRGYHPFGLTSILTGLESSRACEGLANELQPVNHLLHVTRTLESIA
ncbi:hypothetical protein TNCV_959981 [Trichonephila clavipes]|nr:hypothetical protein TNCV_959981 [Trichonephila clavipes]